MCVTVTAVLKGPLRIATSVGRSYELMIDHGSAQVVLDKKNSHNAEVHSNDDGYLQPKRIFQES